MTQEQFAEGIAYAEDNFSNENADHLKVDKALIREKFDLTGKNVLDFGCGMGGMSLWYATSWDCDVLALDIDAHHIEVAKALQAKHQVTNVRFDVRNILDGPLGETFDMVFLNDVAEHIQFDILLPILKALEAHLAPGGQIFVTYPPWKSPYASHVHHIVGMPWCQFLPEKILLKRIEQNDRPIVGALESSLKEAYQGLNHLTHEKLMRLVDQTGLRPVFRKSHTLLNRFGPLKATNLRFFPFDYLITKEFLLLERGGAARV